MRKHGVPCSVIMTSKWSTLHPTFVLYSSCRSRSAARSSASVSFDAVPRTVAAEHLPKKPQGQALRREAPSRKINWFAASHSNLRPLPARKRKRALHEIDEFGVIVVLRLIGRVGVVMEKVRIIDEVAQFDGVGLVENLLRCAETLHADIAELPR
jgi:hypothetical protein